MIVIVYASVGYRVASGESADMLDMVCACRHCRHEREGEEIAGHFTVHTYFTVEHYANESELLCPTANARRSDDLNSYKNANVFHVHRHKKITG
jgi:hypothetical protein